MEATRPGSKLIPIYLDEMNGYDFEDFCAKVLDKLDYGEVEVTPKTGDAGKDIIVRNGESVIFVECKHWTDTPVGRPLIQKLHSAIRTEGASSGLFITTGTYSEQAKDYAKTTVPSIELINGEILSILAKDAGYKLIQKKKPSADSENPIFYYRLPKAEELDGLVQDYINYNFQSSPNPCMKYFITDITIEFWPIYRITANIPFEKYDPFTIGTQKTFAWQTFVLGNTDLEEKYGDSIASLSGEEREKFADNVNELDLWDPQEANRFRIQHFDFNVDIDAVQNYALKLEEEIINDTNLPPKSEVIEDLEKLYLPAVIVNIETAKQAGELVLIIGRYPSMIQALKLKCQICQSYLVKKALVCNTCGSLVCGNDKIFLNYLRHGYICEYCGRTVCLNCAYVIMYGPSNGKVTCEQCKVNAGPWTVKKIM